MVSRTHCTDLEWCKIIPIVPGIIINANVYFLIITDGAMSVNDAYLVTHNLFHTYRMFGYAVVWVYEDVAQEISFF